MYVKTVLIHCILAMLFKIPPASISLTEPYEHNNLETVWNGRKVEAATHSPGQNKWCLETIQSCSETQVLLRRNSICDDSRALCELLSSCFVGVLAACLVAGDKVSSCSSGWLWTLVAQDGHQIPILVSQASQVLGLQMCTATSALTLCSF